MTFTNKSFFLNFNLDILYGCQFSCDGCHVNKTGQNGFPEGDLPKLQTLTNSFLERSYNPSLLLIGPTDVFTAKNTKDILRDEDFQKFVEPFERLSFNTTFLVVDFEVLDILNEFYSDKDIEFKPVVEASQFNNDAYLNRIIANIKLAEDRLIGTFVKPHPQLNLFDYTTLTTELDLFDYHKMNERSHIFFDQGVDYVLSFGRSDTLTKAQKLEMVLWLKDMFNKNITAENLNYMHFTSGYMTDSEEQLFTYRNGEFYYSPIVYDDYVGFEDYFKIELDEWTAEAFEQFKQNLLISQYDNLGNKPCASCKYAPTCVTRGMPFFMDYMEVDHCIIPKDVYDLINEGV